MSVSKAGAVKLTMTELGVSSQLAYVNYLNAFHFMPNESGRDCSIADAAAAEKLQRPASDFGLWLHIAGGRGQPDRSCQAVLSIAWCVEPRAAAAAAAAAVCSALSADSRAAPLRSHGIRRVTVRGYETPGSPPPPHPIPAAATQCSNGPLVENYRSTHNLVGNTDQHTHQHLAL